MEPSRDTAAAGAGTAAGRAATRVCRACHWACSILPRKAALYLLFVVRFFALRAQKRTTDEIGSTMLPQATRHLRVRPRNSFYLKAELIRCRIDLLEEGLVVGSWMVPPSF